MAFTKEGRAQSAMEYLTTYSWAILVIGITLGALYALGLFNPQNVVNNQCVFSADFSCVSQFLYSNGTLSVTLEQSTPYAINVTAIGCNTGINTSYMTQLSTPVYVPIGGTTTFTTSCYANGSIISDQPGQLYRGYILVNYTSLGTGFQHILTGTLIQKTT